jgi:hypothetical protein
MTVELQRKVEARWHLKAPREREACGCIWVLPYGQTSNRYQCFRCSFHRPKKA